MTVFELAPAVQVPLLVILVLAASVWLGGAACLVVMARITKKALASADRVELFTQLGRRWGVVGTGALLVGYACGLLLLLAAAWTVLSTWLVIVAALLAFALGAGIVQARRMTRRRRAAAITGASVPGARGATALRITIVLLSIVVVVLAAVQSVLA